jgi:chromosome segregation ATPase
MVGLLDRFKKEDDDYGEELVEERPTPTYDPEPEVEKVEPINEPELEAKIDNQSSETSSMTYSSSSDIGIDALMSKRVKLEEAIDYVGLMIKNLKEKRTRLEKEIEEESVDIKNLKEKLVKVREYIDEENKGISDLANKRSKVEGKADEVSNIISDLKDKLSGIDNVVNAENEKISSFKKSRQK